MSLIPPPWLREVVRRTEHTAQGIHAQIEVVLEAYRLARSDACPFIEPTLECGDCGTRVMLQESRTRALRAEWWEIVMCHHVRGHLLCQPIYEPHSRNRCNAAQLRNKRKALPWIFDGS